MSIVKMKLISIIGPLKSFDEVVQNQIVDKDFHPENALSVTKNVNGLFPFDLQNPYASGLTRAMALADKFGVECQYKEFKHLNLSEKDASDWIDSICGKFDELEKKSEELSRAISDDTQIIHQLAHMGSITANLDDLLNFTYTGFRFGRLPRDYYTTFRSHVEKTKGVFFMPASIEAEYVYGLYMTPRAFISQIDALFGSMHFEVVPLPQNAHGTPEQATAQLQKEISAAEKELAICNSAQSELIASQSDLMLSYYSYYRFYADTYNIRQYAAHTDKSFYLMGWVPNETIQSFTEGVLSVPGVTVTADDPDPKSTALAPPTKLKTAKLFRPFGSFLSVYGVPSYNELDPTAFLAMTYPILFGIMFGDVGQGIVLMILSLVVWKWKKMKAALIFTLSGLSSTVFGFLYGSFFGDEELLSEWIGTPWGFHVLESTANTNTMLLMAVGLGVMLLSVSIVLNIINGARQKNYQKMFFSASGLSGLVLYWSILFAVGDSMLFHLGFVNLPYILCLIVLPVVLIFLGEPLGELLAGKRNWLPEKKGEYAITNVFELFEVAVSFLSNTVSFIRVGAFALSHAGMMMVVYTISDMTSTSGNIAVLIIGNIFVMCLEGLIVGIQVLRLEFYELFNRFYDGSGKAYQRFTIDYSRH